MRKLFRSIFGLSSYDRKVLGNPVNFDLKDIELIRNSNARITALQNLMYRYKKSIQEPKFKLVFEKTKKIHHYLLSKNRIHELELFHIQNTDHFLSTFNVIMDVHLSPKDMSAEHSRPEIIDIVNKARESKKFGNPSGNQNPSIGKTSPVNDQYQKTENLTIEIPLLSVPDISLNTLTKVKYKRKIKTNEFEERDIGFFSNKEDKDTFLLNVATILNIPIEDLAYVGNAMVNIHNSKNPNVSEYAPILHWKGFMYALNLIDYRLFPVTMQRKT
jgi:hypothetical protein